MAEVQRGRRRGVRPGEVLVLVTVLLATVAVLDVPLAHQALIAMVVLALPGSLLGFAVWGSLALLVAEGDLGADVPWQPVFVLSCGLLVWAQVRLFRAMARNVRAARVPAAPPA